jgi:malonyl-CoA O-methyltransferase
MVTPAIEAYSRIAAVYDAAPNPMVSLESRLVTAMLPPLAGRLVLDVAAGTGRWAAWCGRRGARTISADFSREMLAQAPPDRVLADMNSLPLPDAVAAVTICAFGMGYAPGCLGELARVTRPGGCVIVTDVHPEGIARGWRRTFRVNDEVIEPRSVPYQISDLCAAGLVLAALQEEFFGEPELAIFESAGKAAEFELATGHPAVFAAKWIRT